jgi:hypothetical protein
MTVLNTMVYTDGLSLFTGANKVLHLNSQEPVNLTEATSTYTVGNKTAVAATLQNRSGGGKEAAFGSITAITVTSNAATASHWSVVDTNLAELLAANSITTPKVVYTADGADLTGLVVGIPDPGTGFLADTVFDNGLLQIAGSNASAVHLTTQEPATFTEATSTYTAGNRSSPGGTEGARAGGGREVAFGSQAITVTDDGATASHYALVRATGSVLLASRALSATRIVYTADGATLAAFDIGIPNAV